MPRSWVKRWHRTLCNSVGQTRKREETNEPSAPVHASPLFTTYCTYWSVKITTTTLAVIYYVPHVDDDIASSPSCTRAHAGVLWRDASHRQPTHNGFDSANRWSPPRRTHCKNQAMERRRIEENQGYVRTCGNARRLATPDFWPPRSSLPSSSSP
jgi:hypothetical protein